MLTTKTDMLGNKYWFKSGKLHREDGPAVVTISDSTAEEWFLHGKRHRTDGPAIISGTKSCNDGHIEWWIDGHQLTIAEFAATQCDKETALLWKMSGYCWPFDLQVIR